MQVIQRPVTGEDSFNREDILEFLKVERNLALIGQRRVGKTSIILEYLRRNPDPQSLTAYIYVLLEETPPSLARKCLRALLISLLSTEGDEVDAFSPGEDLATQAIQAIPPIGELTAQRDYSIIQMVADTPSTERGVDNEQIISKDRRL